MMETTMTFKWTDFQLLLSKQKIEPTLNMYNLEDIASIMVFLLRSSMQGTLQFQGLCKDAYEWKKYSLVDCAHQK
jgi:hypothetical protein